MLRTIYIFLIFSFLVLPVKAGEEKDIMLVEVDAIEAPDTVSSEFRAMLPEMKTHSKPSIMNCLIRSRSMSRIGNGCG